MSASSKKSIPLSAYDRSRLVTEHARRASAAEKIFDASNPEPTNISDRQKLISEDTDKMLVSRAKGHNQTSGLPF